jgi:SAM-dependent methyltransferase
VLMLSLLRRFIPQPVLQKTELFVRHMPADLLDKILGNTDPLIPPRRKVFTGGGHFREIGDEFFGYFRQYGKIAPQHRILDIGSGIGRMARPLTSFLDPSKGGRYEGFDIDVGGVLWCMEHYIDFPHFRFQRANIYNKFYNPSGTVKAEEFSFPYPDASFDFAFATSVFTHMPLPAVARYLKELARVLAPGARALLTLFAWNPESRSLVEQGKSKLAFRPHGDLIVIDPVVPEDAIALPQEGWLAALRDAGLEPVGDVLWGNWCGRASATSFQDIAIVRKPG